MALTPLKSLPFGTPKLPSFGFGKPLSSYPKPMNFAPSFQSKPVNSGYQASKPNPVRTSAGAFPKDKSDAYSFSVGGTGAGFREKGVSGFDSRFSRYTREHRLAFENLSKDDKKEIHDIIETRARAKGIGSKFSYRDRKIMTDQALKDYKSGEISSEDLGDFKKIIGKLKE